MENLVKKYLIEHKLLPADKFVQSMFIHGDEWEIYQIDENTVLYIFFELTDDGWGYVFCVRIKCGKMRHDTKYFYYVKSPDNFLRKEWEDCSQYMKDQLMFDAINRLKVYSGD